MFACVSRVFLVFVSSKMTLWLFWMFFSVTFVGGARQDRDDSLSMILWPDMNFSFDLQKENKVR